MFQLSFLNAGLLIISAATILPLIIWLLAKKKPPQVIFSTIRFISNTEKEQKSRTQIKNILLLIIRMLIILLIVLAASRPALRITGLKPAKQHPPTAVAILLDTSFSMDYTDNSKSTLEKAKSAILQINKRLNNSDISVLITSDEGWNRMNAQLHNGKLPDNQIKSIKSTWLPLKIEEMLQLADARLKQSQFSNREIYLLTDGQNQELPEGQDIPVMLIPIKTVGNWDNISCVNARPVMELTNRQQTQVISFDVINHGNQVRRDVLVRVDFNGVKAAEKFVTLQPGQRLTETLPVQVMSSGWQKGYVEVLDEKLTADNRCWFTFYLDLHPNIGIITSKTSLPLVMETVLKVFATPQGSVRLISTEQVNFQQLKDYSLLVVYAAGEFTPRLREFLQTCEQSHKGVLYCADANLYPGWKTWFKELYGLNLDQFNTTASHITYVNPFHPVTSLIETDQFSEAGISGFWKAQNPSSANILLSADNSPLAVAGSNSLLWLFDPAVQNGRFFLEAAFPVFAYRSMQYLANARFESEIQKVGKLLTGDELTLPGGENLELNGNQYKTLEPGIYSVSWRGGSSQDIAIQPDAEESNSKPLVIPKNSVYRVLGSNWQEQLFLSRLGHDIWKYLLLAALFLLLLELVIVKSEEWKKGTART
jgi:hypothetical protein